MEGITWEKLEENKLKANWDSKAKTTGLCVIIRDSAGEIQVSSCCNLRAGYQPAIAEATALRNAMTICNDLGFIQVIFEWDRKRVFKVVNSFHEKGTELSLLIHDIQYMILQNRT